MGTRSKLSFMGGYNIHKMKIYKNQNKQNATANGFIANYEFVIDKVMTPSGVDEMDIVKDKDNELIAHEVSKLNEDGTVTVYVLTLEEYVIEGKDGKFVSYGKVYLDLMKKLEL